MTLEFLCSVLSLSLTVVLVSCSPVCAHTNISIHTRVALLFCLSFVHAFINKLLFRFFVSYKAHQTPRNSEPIGQADNLQRFDINTTLATHILASVSVSPPITTLFRYENMCMSSRGAHEQQQQHFGVVVGDRFVNCRLSHVLLYWKSECIIFVFTLQYIAPNAWLCFDAGKMYYWTNKRQIKRMNAAIASDFDL